MRRLAFLLLAVAALAGIAPALAAGRPADAAGAPDPSFGRNGFLYSQDVLVGIGEDGTQFDRFRLLPDGGVVVTSRERCSMDCVAGLLSRYASDGTFVSTSRYSITNTSGRTVSTGSYVRPDGGLVVSTSDVGEDDGRPAPPVRRYLRIQEPDGSSREADLAGPFVPWSVMADGGLLGLDDRRLLRLGPDLAPDAGFAAVVPPLLATVGEAAATKSTIRVSGYDARGVSLARFDLAGGLTRVARVPVIGPEVSYATGARLLVRRDGHAFVIARIVLRKQVNGEGVQTAVAAFLPDGRVDRSFGRGGLLRVAQGDAAIAFQRDGRIIVAGSRISRAASDNGGQLLLRRLTTTGRSDPTFPTRRIRVRPGHFAGLDVAVDRRDRIVVAGGAFMGYTKSGLMLARFLAGPR